MQDGAVGVKATMYRGVTIGLLILCNLRKYTTSLDVPHGALNDCSSDHFQDISESSIYAAIRRSLETRKICSASGLSGSQRLRSIILALLMIGGIESNPGPFEEDMVIAKPADDASAGKSSGSWSVDDQADNSACEFEQMPTETISMIIALQEQIAENQDGNQFKSTLIEETGFSMDDIVIEAVNKRQRDTEQLEVENSENESEDNADREENASIYHTSTTRLGLKYAKCFPLARIRQSRLPYQALSKIVNENSLLTADERYPLHVNAERIENELKHTERLMTDIHARNIQVLMSSDLINYKSTKDRLLALQLNFESHRKNVSRNIHQRERKTFDCNTNDIIEPVKDVLWYENEAILHDAISTIQAFCAFHDVAGNRESCNFVVLLENVPNKLSHASELSPIAKIVCKECEEVEEEVIFPNFAANLLKIDNAGIYDMKLVWPTPTQGAENVTEIVILASLENNSFIQMDTIQVGTTFHNEALVQNLKPSTSYRFKLLLLTKWGCMPEPEVCTEETRTKPEPRALRLRSEAQLADDSEWPNTQVYVPLKKEVERARKDFTLTTGQSGGVRKYIIGGEHKDLDQDKVLLVVGGTGAGKTTLINSMVNYLYEVKKEDEFRFRLVSQIEETQESGYSTKVKSKTKWVTAFVLNNTRLHYRLTVVDTPGFGDTEGIQRDKETTRYIKEWFSQKGPDGLDRLDAVCMVVKSSETRLTHQAQFELNQVVALFGKDMESNILPLLTFCDASKPPALEALKAANVPFKNYYKFNNSAFFEGSDMDEFQKMFWKLGVSSFEKFFEGIEILPVRSLSLSKEVCEKRERLEFQVIALQFKVAQEITQLETMRQEFEVMKNHEADIQRNSDFSYTVVEQRQIMCDLEGTGQHTTNCLNCNITCHESCAYSDDKDKEKCWAMTDGKCRICPLKCEWNFHKNLPYIIARIPLTIRKTNEDLKRKYEQAVSNKELAENMLESIAEQLMKTQSEINADIQLTRQHLRELSKIAMRPSRMTEVSYIEIMIANEKSNAENGWQQRVEHLEHQLKIAKAIAEANDPNYDPLAKYKQSTEGKLNFLAERFPKISEGWLADKAKSAVKKSKAAFCAVGNFLIGSEDNSNPAHKKRKSKMPVIQYV